MFIYNRFDLTSEKRYTLSKATKKLIENLDNVVYVKVYLEGDFPAGFKRLRNSTKEMLDEFRAISKENIQYEFINPSEDSDEKVRKSIYQQLTKQGLQYTNLEVKEGDSKSEQIIFPGAIITYKGKETPLQLLKSRVGAQPEEMLNTSIQQLEYELANSIRKLGKNIKQKIAFIEGHGELDEFHVKDITTSLGEYYDVERIRINGQINALKGFTGIVIAKPDSFFSEKDKYIIDQFLMGGGKMLCFIDGVQASMDSLQTNSNTIGASHNVNLDDQLFKYGVRINNNLVQDIQSSPIPIITGYIGNQPQQKLFSWFYFPLLLPIVEHPIVNNLNAIKSEFISTIDTVGSPVLKKTFLLHTSKYTKLVNSPARISINMVRDEPDIRQFSKKNEPVAVLIEGTFESVFKNRITQQLQESNELRFKDKSAPTKIIVVADGDVIKNPVQKSKGLYYPLGYDKYTREVFDNKTFVLNAVNYLCDDSGLISVRSRELKLRLLDVNKINKEKMFWQIINMVLPIALIIAFGTLQFFIRKRKYTS